MPVTAYASEYECNKCDQSFSWNLHVEGEPRRGALYFKCACGERSYLDVRAPSGQVQHVSASDVSSALDENPNQSLDSVLESMF